MADTSEPKPERSEIATTDEESARLRRRVLIVGAGQTGRALARVLSDSWDIAVLDPDEERLAGPNKKEALVTRSGASRI